MFQLCKPRILVMGVVLAERNAGNPITKKNKKNKNRRDRNGH